MERIFISSLARGDMGPIRVATRKAVEALDMVPVMFETGPASDEGSRRTLLNRVAASDAVVLVLGARYGEASERGVSPTEEEFNEAVAHGIPVLPLVQDVDHEPAQAEFLDRVRGTWEQGRLTADFNDALDVGFAVTKALNAWRRDRETDDAAPAAAAQALELAKGDERPGMMAGGSKLRVSLAPVVSRPLLDAVSLRDPNLIDGLSEAARSSRLAPQSAGIETVVERDRITLQITGGRGFETLTLHVGFNGSVVGEGPVGGDDSHFGGAVVMADRARQVMQRTIAFTEGVWQRIDARDEVRDVFIACAVPEANYKIYALQPVGSTLSFGSGLPQVLVVPDQALRSRRASLPDVVAPLEAELHRAFELQRAVHPGASDQGSRW